MQHPLEQPAESAGELYVPTGISPEDLFQAIGRLRKEARDEIDRLLSFLDATDGDADLEDDETEDDPDREPSLAAPDARGPDDQSRWAAGDRTDLVEESLGDDEPSLGWTADGVVGMPCWHPDQVDIEDEHDGTEPDICGEPDLGSFDRMLDQEKSWQQRPMWVQEGEVDVLDAGAADVPHQATEGLANA